MIAISGGNGFLGKHCKIFCKMNKLENVVFIDRKNFKDKQIVKKLNSCKYFIHLADINRSNKSLTQINFKTLKYYIDNLKNNKNLKKIIYASSIHRNLDNDYGRSKRKNEKELKLFCKIKKIDHKIIIFGNIFGEFCKPNYNSVVATICNDLIKNKKFDLKKNKKLGLVYAQDVVKYIFKSIKTNSKINNLKYDSISVLNLYKKLFDFKEYYFNHSIPDFKSKFDLNLFNTLRSYAFPNKIKLNTKNHMDSRGNLWEVIKAKNTAQMFLSTTKKSKVRGNHFHTKKIERFIILQGSALIKFRYIFEKKIHKILVKAKDKQCVDIPTYCTHNLTNNSNKNLLTLFFSNEIYNPKKPDTYYEKV